MIFLFVMFVRLLWNGDVTNFLFKGEFLSFLNIGIDLPLCLRAITFCLEVYNIILSTTIPLIYMLFSLFKINYLYF